MTYCKDFYTSIMSPHIHRRLLWPQKIAEIKGKNSVSLTPFVYMLIDTFVSYG